MASTPHLVWALRQRDLTAAERLVLIYLADRANGAMVCWPMIATIAEALELSERSVMRAVQTLEDKDLIRVDRRHRQFNHYHILRPENGSDPEAEHPEPCVTKSHPSDVRVTQSQSSVTESHPTSVTESHPSVTACHPSEAARGDTQSLKPPFLGDTESHDPLKEVSLKEGRKKEPPKPPASGGPRDRTAYPADFDAFWMAYPRKAGKRAALKAWTGAIVRAGDAGVIMAGLASHRFTLNADFIPHPSTWLNRDQWLDVQDTTDPVLRAVGLSGPVDLAGWPVTGEGRLLQ